jgi:dihydrofolate reductase
VDQDPDVVWEKGATDMSKVFVSMGISLDGCVAEPNRSIENMGSEGWMSLHRWVFAQKAFREHLQLGEGGETGEDNRFLESVFTRIGVNIMGKKMFKEGERGWPEEAPFHTPVFVVTHEVREPWERKGGTTFYFVNDGIEEALRRAREVAGGKDIRISGGADIVRQYLNAGLVDELMLSVAPTFLGNGLRLFDGIDANAIGLEIIEAIPSPQVTHLRYAVKKR